MLLDPLIWDQAVIHPILLILSGPLICDQTILCGHNLQGRVRLTVLGSCLIDIGDYALSLLYSSGLVGVTSIGE